MLFITCSKNGSSNTNSTDIAIIPYYGTYLFQDKKCLGSDIELISEETARSHAPTS